MSSCYFDGGRILLPGCDLTRWATIACDQFTSDPAYWQQVSVLAQNVPSAYHISLPEIYLKEGEAATAARIATINQTMQDYLQQQLFTAYDQSMIYIRRRLADGRIRHGLLGLVDLEQYDYHAGATSYIRATEATVLERIPPRVRIRKDAPLEMPHLMLLADDPDNRLFASCAEYSRWTQVYDFDLMQDSGHISGYLLDDSAKAAVRAVLQEFSDPSYFADRYQTDAPPLVFAVGDGNHSLASAKECYEQLKSTLGPEAAAVHPARYALAELVNLHDPSLDFEPIYRILIGADLEDLLSFIRRQNTDFHGGASHPGEISLHFQSQLEQRTLSLPVCAGILPVSILQPLLDDYLQLHPEVEIDYIHGLDTVRALGKQPGHVAITFRGMQKADLFPGIIRGGVLPRKTFSMGHAQDKRFYLECREIRP